MYCDAPLCVLPAEEKKEVVFFLPILPLSPKPLFRMVGDEVTLATANPKPCIILSHYTAFQGMVI
jgi:hypothetical protein